MVILDNQNRPMPTGKIGELCIRGPNVTRGYLNNPKANEEAFAGERTAAFAISRQGGHMLMTHSALFCPIRSGGQACGIIAGWLQL